MTPFDIQDESMVDKIVDKPSDYTSRYPVSGRTFHINLGILRFGTSDAIQGAAFFLAFFLLLIFALVALTGYFTEDGIDLELLNWISNPLLLTIGVAIGRTGS